jgi:hypothetical protein
MAEEAGAAAAGSRDIRFEWLQSRVCSSLKVTEESFQKLLTSEFK